MHRAMLLRHWGLLKKIKQRRRCQFLQKIKREKSGVSYHHVICAYYRTSFCERQCQSLSESSCGRWVGWTLHAANTFWSSVLFLCRALTRLPKSCLRGCPKAALATKNNASSRLRSWEIGSSAIIALATLGAGHNDLASTTARRAARAACC